MVKTKKFKGAVREIVFRTRTYVPEIGNYVEHFATGDFEFVVHLTNGRLRMPGEAAHTYETTPSNIPESWIEEIAGSFEFQVPEINQPSESMWHKILGSLNIRR